MKQIYQILFHNQCTTCALCVQILCIFSISRRKTKVWVSWKKHGSYIWKYTARLTNKIIWYKTYCCSVMKIYILNCILLTWCVGTFLFRDNRIGIVFYNTYFIVDKAKISFVMQSYTMLIFETTFFTILNSWICTFKWWNSGFHPLCISSYLIILSDHFTWGIWK